VKINKKGKEDSFGRPNKNLPEPTTKEQKKNKLTGKQANYGMFLKKVFPSRVNQVPRTNRRIQDS
jgi:hypothetical protein